jgi:hypothetical protein
MIVLVQSLWIILFFIAMDEELCPVITNLWSLLASGNRAAVITVGIMFNCRYWQVATEQP